MIKIIIFAILIMFSCDTDGRKTRRKITVNEILSKIDKSKSDKLDFIEKRKYFLQVLAENEDMKETAITEGYEFGFATRFSPNVYQFPCKNYSIPGSGKNVNNLTPSDIKVMAALGDSLTAGLGLDATNIFGVLWENREKVFSIGGKEGAQTLVNMFRVFNPNVLGYSTKTTFIRSQGNGLNVAVSGDTSEDLMNQLINVIKLMKSDPQIDYQNDWKMITIFIGNNDICRSCEPFKSKKFNVELFKKRVMDVLDKLKAEVPKAFVNLVTMLDVYRVKELNKGIICTALHLYECYCVAFSTNIQKIIQLTSEFQTAVTEISNADKYNDKSDFAVVTQPFFENTYVPMINGEPDLSYFAPDCFHLSEKGHSQVALSLWNSLFEPISEKKRYWHVGEQFKCPTVQNPYFTTRNNSV